MIGIILFLLFLLGCESKPTEEQLVRECQSRNGTPDVGTPGVVKCEMPRFSQNTQSPARYN